MSIQYTVPRFEPDLRNMSLLPLPLDQGSRPIKAIFAQFSARTEMKDRRAFIGEIFDGNQAVIFIY